MRTAFKVLQVHYPNVWTNFHITAGSAKPRGRKAAYLSDGEAIQNCPLLHLLGCSSSVALLSPRFFFTHKLLLKSLPLAQRRLRLNRLRLSRYDSRASTQPLTTQPLRQKELRARGFIWLLRCIRFERSSFL